MLGLILKMGGTRSPFVAGVSPEPRAPLTPMQGAAFEFATSLQVLHMVCGNLQDTYPTLSMEDTCHRFWESSPPAHTSWACAVLHCQGLVLAYLPGMR